MTLQYRHPHQLASLKTLSGSCSRSMTTVNATVQQRLREDRSSPSPMSRYLLPDSLKSCSVILDRIASCSKILQYVTKYICRISDERWVVLFRPSFRKSCKDVIFRTALVTFVMKIKRYLLPLSIKSQHWSTMSMGHTPSSTFNFSRAYF